nr:MAG TPA: hypothetical protein [Caudoviricetes sp.]
MAKQVIFTNYNDKVEAGILTNNGTVICGSNGFEIPTDDCVILKIYPKWVELEAEITETETTLYRIQTKLEKIPKSKLEAIYELPSGKIPVALLNALNEKELNS